jgi:hypothetical protein
VNDTVRDALELELVVNRAAELARAGDLNEAARLLDETDTSAGGPAAVAALDLLARVRAQLGDFAAADECWARVQELAADDPAAAEGRLVAQAILDGRRRARPRVHTGWSAVLVAGITVALVAGGGVWLTRSAVGPAEPVTADPLIAAVERARADAARSAAEQRRTEADRYATLARQLIELESERADLQVRQWRALDDLARRLAIPGVRVEHRASDVRVVFDNGVFQSGTRIRPEATELLTELGRRLSRLNVSTTVVGHSVTVPGGATGGGSQTALLRAQFAARYLATGGDLPLTAFTLVSADQSDGPFEQRWRNRTVTLLVRPLGSDAGRDS